MSDTLLRDLQKRLGADAVSAGTAAAAYSPAPRPPVAAIFPSTPEAVGEAMALLDGTEATVLPWGGGTALLPIERPPTVTMVTTRMNQLVDYQPDDMTVTVQAGMALADLQTILAERGQVLPLDPPHAERATLGGVVASNRTGPWRCAYRTPRDWLIGLTVIGADGRAVRGGGRVVKNVAGYDLPHLYTGSRGTLGVIVELSFKVMPRPAASGLVVVPLESSERAEAAIERVMDSDLIPNCLELLNARAWGELTEAPLAAGRPFVLLVGFEGVAAAVTWQVHALHDMLSGMGATVAIPEARRDALWRELRDFGARSAFLTASAALTSSDVAAFVETCAHVAASHQLNAVVAAHAFNGIVRARLQSPGRDPIRTAEAVDQLRAEADRRGGSLWVVSAAPEMTGRVDFWGAPSPTFRLMRGLKEALDPHGTFHPGGFLGGL